MASDRDDNPSAQPEPLPHVTALLQALREVKTSKNLSLDAFAHDTGYSRSSWNRVLKAEAFPPRTAVERLCARRGLDKKKMLGLWDEADLARQHATTAVASPAALGAAPADAEEPGTAKPAPCSSAATGTAPGTGAPKTATDAAPLTTGPDPAASTSAPPPKADTAAQPHPPAAPRRRITTLAMTLVVLLALLLAGRWYTTQDSGDTAAPSQSDGNASNRPTDEQPAAEEEPLQPTQSAAPGASAGGGTVDGGDRSTGRGKASGQDEDSRQEEKASEELPPADEEATSGPDSSPSPPPVASASPSATTQLGAAGRADCNFNWDRTQTMAKGMVGSKVKEIQCLLNSNYSNTLTVDGNFGEGTKVAVQAVQRCSGITADGQVGPQTWKYLDTPLSGCGH